MSTTTLPHAQGREMRRRMDDDVCFVVHFHCPDCDCEVTDQWVDPTEDQTVAYCPDCDGGFDVSFPIYRKDYV